MSAVLYEVRDGIGVVTLNRPQCLNAINAALLDEFVGALESANAADDVAVVLLRASGRAFCAGDDLEEFAQAPYEAGHARAFIERLQNVTRLIMLGDKPVVCAAQGWIVGGGAAWPLNADFALVADDATLFCPEAGLGLFPSGGMTILLAERCGPVAAGDVLWRGVRRDAQELVDQHVVSRVVAHAQLDAEALAVAQALCAIPGISRMRLKRARRNDLGERLERALAYEAECCLQAALDPEVRRRAVAAAKG